MASLNTDFNVSTATKLPPCHSRRAFNPEQEIFFCAHPAVHVAQQLVNPSICEQCSRWREPQPARFREYPTKIHVRRDGPCMYLGSETGLRECATCRGKVRLKEYQCNHVNHDNTTLKDCHTCFDYEARLAVGTIRSWAVGITTAPRREPTLGRCLTSIAQAGWTEGHVFAEPESEIPSGLGEFAVTNRGMQVGAWPNFFLGLAELYMRYPYADAFLMLQDDVVLCRNLRTFLERSLWNAPVVGLVSVYCPSTYASRERGFQRIESDDGLIGALTYVFPNSSVRSLLADSELVEHRLRGKAGLEGIDTVIGKWAQRKKLPAFYHSPSLAQHFGNTSTIWPVDSSRGRRSAGDFVGESFDALSLVSEPFVKAVNPNPRFKE